MKNPAPLGSKLWYLATVYTLHPHGLEAAYKDAQAYTATLLAAGLRCFSPIAYWHCIGNAAGIDPILHEYWMDADRPFMDRCDGIIVAQTSNWEMSKGIKYEIEHFRKFDKPIFYWYPHP